MAAAASTATQSDFGLFGPLAQTAPKSVSPEDLQEEYPPLILSIIERRREEALAERRRTEAEWRARNVEHLRLKRQRHYCPEKRAAFYQLRRDVERANNARWVANNAAHRAAYMRTKRAAAREAANVIKRDATVEPVVAV